MSTTLLAVDDGLIRGNLDAADLLFLVAAVVFGVAAFLRFTARAVDAGLVAVGLCLTAIAWLVL
jgi:hypothetical protein